MATLSDTAIQKKVPLGDLRACVCVCVFPQMVLKAHQPVQNRLRARVSVRELERRALPSTYQAVPVGVDAVREAGDEESEV